MVEIKLQKLFIEKIAEAKASKMGKVANYRFMQRQELEVLLVSLTRDGDQYDQIWLLFPEVCGSAPGLAFRQS